MNSMQSESVVRAAGLTRIFRDFWRRPKVRAVDDVSFEVRRGEVFGLLGPNGSGKTTAIKMILGLLHPTSGSLEVLGRPPRDVRAKHELGYLPEESALYPYLSAEETLHFYGKLFDLPREERRRRVDQLVDMTGLAAARHRPVGEFSKGMTRRVGLAQALINDPALILLDEPTSGLDPLGRRQVKDIIRTLASRGKSVLVSSHLLAEIEDVCDRIAILYDGRIRASGALDELLEERQRYLLDLPAMPPAELEALLEDLAGRLGERPGLAHPRIDLERYFLDVVARARGGGGGEGAMAAYLSHSAEDGEGPGEARPDNA
ncbi:ABC transporter ATP-binding protein [Kiritimatiella glycovorans]|uniref:Putative ABC transporter ATP-binding protein YxlF n=1 Tax=Kiritimatiella glycovorans TaxID=1307763 RepID=A0A0G3EJG3_9BACT|nr:ABC transporter ATP-binding protein [Kiritimatiella glycovorans]AKJ65582.1 putative ABC transporter ATP-binding protein YxlF [Kiritimatiella glycovorans]